MFFNVCLTLCSFCTLQQFLSREKPAGKQEQQSRHRALFIPKEGKETLEVNLGKEHGLATKENGIGSRLCGGKVLAPLRIRRTRRDPRTIERKMVAKNTAQTHIKHWLKETQENKQDGLDRISHPGPT